MGVAVHSNGVRTEPAKSVNLSEQTWLTLKQASEYFKIPLPTLRYYIKLGIVTRKHGLRRPSGTRRWLINRVEFEQKFLGQGDEE